VDDRPSNPNLAQFIRLIPHRSRIRPEP
jgi:hypothetical protein